MSSHTTLLRMISNCTIRNAYILLHLLILPATILQAQSNKKLNVLLIAVDDLNDWVGAFKGYPGVHTPNFDRLAKMGMKFTKAYCAAPACNPSRTALLTGVRPSSSGVYHNNQPWRPALPHAITLPQYFTANGYEVMGIGKIFHGPYDDSASWPKKYKNQSFPEPDQKPQGGYGNFDWGPLAVRDEDLGDYEHVQKGIEFLSQDHQRPFFLALGLIKPHLPWYVPQKYFDEYPLASIKRPKVKEKDLDDVPEIGKRMAANKVGLNTPQNDHEFILKNNQWEKAIQGYLASISFADAQVGRLLDALEKSNYLKNTIIVFFGDHGWNLGEKEHWRKFALWEETTRVPFIIVAPGLAGKNAECSRTVNLMDIYPTLLSICGLPVKNGLEGNDLMPLLKNPKARWDHASLTTHGLNNHAVRSERWRYIRYADGTEELYDHNNDPNEFTNRAGEPAMAPVKKMLSAYLPVINAPNAPPMAARNPAGE